MPIGMKSGLPSPICRPGGLTKPGDARAEESAAASLCPATHFISPFYRPRYYPQFYGVQPVYMSISFKLFIKTFRQVLKSLVVAATLLRLAFLRRAIPYPTLSRRSVSTCHSSRAAETFDPLGNKHVASSTIIIPPSCIISRFPGRFVDEKAPGGPTSNFSGTSWRMQGFSSPTHVRAKLLA